MQILFPYEEPFNMAEALTESDLDSMIKSLRKLIETNPGKDKEWYDRCCIALDLYRDKMFNQASWWSVHAGFVKPEWLTPERCASDRKKLYEKHPRKYAKFYDSGDAGAAEEKKA